MSSLHSMQMWKYRRLRLLAPSCVLVFFRSSRSCGSSGNIWPVQRRLGPWLTSTAKCFWTPVTSLIAETWEVGSPSVSSASSSSGPVLQTRASTSVAQTIGTSFTLTTWTSKRRTRSPSLPGQWTIGYFGFTHLPSWGTIVFLLHFLLLKLKQCIMFMLQPLFKRLSHNRKAEQKHPLEIGLLSL